MSTLANRIAALVVLVDPVRSRQLGVAPVVKRTDRWVHHGYFNVCVVCVAKSSQRLQVYEYMGHNQVPVIEWEVCGRCDELVTQALEGTL